MRIVKLCLHCPILSRLSTTLIRSYLEPCDSECIPLVELSHSCTIIRLKQHLTVFVHLSVSSYHGAFVRYFLYINWNLAERNEAELKSGYAIVVI